MAEQKPTAAVATRQPQAVTLIQLFDQQKAELAKVLPKGMSVERIIRMARTEILKNPKLADCTAQSWALALQTCAQQGLYPDSGLGEMYLIPRENNKKVGNTWEKRMEVTAQRGYQGDIKLVRNSGELTDIWAEVVYEKDEYKVTKGLNRDIVHVPYDGADEPGKLKAVYAVAKLKDGSFAFVTLTARDVARHRMASQGADSDSSPWKKHTEAMWKKSAVRELYKWLPKSTEKALDMREHLDDAIDVTPTTALPNPTLTVEPEAQPAMEQLTERLEAQRAAAPIDVTPTAATEEAPAPKDCKHPGVPPSKVAALPFGRAIVCQDCGEEITNPDATEAVEREPGSDDGDAPAPGAGPGFEKALDPDANPVDAVKALAGKAGAQGSTTGARQRRLQE